MALPPRWVTTVRLVLLWSMATRPTATCCRLGAVWAAATGTMNRLKAAPLRRRRIRDGVVFRRGVIRRGTGTATHGRAPDSGETPDGCEIWS